MTTTGKTIRAAMLLTMALALAVLSGCGEAAVDPKKPMTPAEMDKLAAKELADTMMVAEAKDWLDENKIKNMLLRAEKAPTRLLVHNLYDAGCPKVAMVNINFAGGNQLCNTIVVQLPTTPAQRVKAFRAISDYWANMEMERLAPTDTGQAYYRFNPS